MKNIEFIGAPDPDGVPRMPEFMQLDTFLGLGPSDIVYAHTYSFKMHQDDRRLLIDTKDKVSHDLPVDGGGDIPVLRVYETIDGSLRDGFIADFRRNSGFQVRTQDELNVDGDNWGTQTLLAAIFLDPEDGQIYYTGSALFHDHARFLLKAADDAFTYEDENNSVESSEQEDVLHPTEITNE